MVKLCTPSLASKKHYKFVNHNKQPQAIKCVCAYNLLMVGPLTMKLGTLMYHDESSWKHKVQACKQQQTASGNQNFNMVFVPINN